MHKKLWLCGLLIFVSQKEPSAFAGDFTHNRAKKKLTPEEILDSKYEDIDLKQAHEWLAEGRKIPKNILSLDAMQRDPELVLFYGGVAGVNLRFSNGLNALRVYIENLATLTPTEKVKNLIKNLVYVGVPLEFTLSNGKHLSCEEMLNQKMQLPFRSDYREDSYEYLCAFYEHEVYLENAAAFLKNILEAKLELDKAREEEIAGIAKETGLNRNCTSLVLSYAFENFDNEYFMPAAIRTKIENMQGEQDELRHAYEKNVKKSAWRRLCCCS